MRILPIIVGLLVLGAVALFFSASDQISSYGNFEVAKASNQKMKVIAYLSKNKPMVYQPDVNPNIFTFYAKDDNGVEAKVVLGKEKPRDVERSESIVITGQFKNDVFYASEILTKCPSKYKDEEIFIREEI